jgi:hypothetical protein
VSSLIKIGIIGDYDRERPSHKTTNEALNGITSVVMKKTVCKKIEVFLKG